MTEKKILYKVPQGLGYKENSGNFAHASMNSQSHIQPQMAVLKAVTPQEIKAHLNSLKTTLKNDNQCTEYPVVCNSNLRGPKWAGVL
jgi:hypothetical protein